MFPNRMDCYFALFQDAVYEHDNKIEYVIEVGQFKRRDRVAVVNQIAAMVDLLYQTLAVGDATFTRCRPLIDYPALLGVFTRYSRDIYGFRRISAKIQNLETALNQNHKEQLEQIILGGQILGSKYLQVTPTLSGRQLFFYTGFLY